MVGWGKNENNRKGKYNTRMYTIRTVIFLLLFFFIIHKYNYNILFIRDVMFLKCKTL